MLFLEVLEKILLGTSLQESSSHTLRMGSGVIAKVMSAINSMGGAFCPKEGGTSFASLSVGKTATHKTIICKIQ